MNVSRPALLLGRHWMDEHRVALRLLEERFSIHTFDMLNLRETMELLTGVAIKIALVRADVIDLLSPFTQQLLKDGFSIEHVVSQDIGRSFDARRSPKDRGLCGTLDANASPPAILELLLAIVDLCAEHPSVSAFSNERDKISAAVGAGNLDEIDLMILSMLANGSPDEEIAQRLHFSNQTIRNRVSSMLHTVKLQNRTELAVAWRNHVFRSEIVQ